VSSGSATALLPRRPAVPYLAVVRRGNAGVFRTLRETVGRQGRVEVIWDRRLADRRATAGAGGPDRRRGERRQRPGDPWLTLGFVMVPGEVLD